MSEPITLWPGGAPGALGTSPKDIPTLTPYLPAKPTGAAMLLIPGGSYSGIYEGQAEPFALWLNEHGLTVFVLRYRLGSAGYRYPAQLQDAVEAMFQIRGNAAKWKIDPQRIGVMGFCAGMFYQTWPCQNPTASLCRLKFSSFRMMIHASADSTARSLISSFRAEICMKERSCEWPGTMVLAISLLFVGITILWRHSRNQSSTYISRL
jgi:hypothetical protein